MENPALAQQVKVLLLCAMGLLFALLIGWNIGSENYYPLLLGAVIIVVAAVSFLSGPYFWPLTIASSFLGGTFPILGGSFTPFQILMGIGVVKFLVGDVVLRRAKLSLGTRNDALLIFGFMGILTLHAVHDRFGMKFLGSSVWGGRNYVNVYVGLVAFIVIQNIRMSSKVWAKLPYVVLAVTAFDLTIAVITTIFPGAIYKIYPFYSAVSRSGLEEVLTGTAVETARVGSFGNFGAILITLVLASTPIQRVFLPGYFFRFVALVIGGLGVLFSSFRSAVFNAVSVGFVAAVRDLKWGAIALAPLLAIALFALSILNSEFIPLPKQVQRSLTFVPGKWDVDMTLDTAASNDFRAQVWTIWQKEFFPEHPWIGRGFGFKSQWAERSVYRTDPNELRQMVETGNVHNGLFATVDCLGILGTILFIIWNLRLLARVFRITFRITDPAATALRFLALILGSSVICYWIGAQNVGAYLPQEFALAGVFLRLQKTIAPESAVALRNSRKSAGALRVDPVPA